MVAFAGGLEQPVKIVPLNPITALLASLNLCLHLLIMPSYQHKGRFRLVSKMLPANIVHEGRTYCQPYWSMLGPAPAPS